ncbi:hypothetical protein [Arhodomonas sp. SL1]|uniref:hypothetical protein n=1 Tax=Arhodomonas sp. SL1 TaxID=3425691 RepID=UPI003F88343E
MSRQPARVAGVERVAGGWWWLRLSGCESRAAPGSFRMVHFKGWRFCLPLDHASPAEGWVGGLLPPAALPAELGPGSPVRVDASAGQELPRRFSSAPVILGEDAGLGPALALAPQCEPAPRLVILGSWGQPPARLCPSQFLVPGLPAEAIAGVAPLEAAHIAARVASRSGAPGCHEGEALELLERYLMALPEEARRDIPLLVCVPEDRLRHQLAGLRRTVASVTLAEYPAD